MTIESELLPGAFVIRPTEFADSRGFFIKTYQKEAFDTLGISFTPTEEFYSSSHSRVVRGMHFQRPPYDHSKLVYCIRGRVRDVLLDLRRNSPVYGRATSIELSLENRRQLFIPTGIAHGFLSLADESVMVYKTNISYAPAHDSGIRWDSFGFEWGVDCPIVSKRDLSFQSFQEFITPFQ